MSSKEIKIVFFFLFTTLECATSFITVPHMMKLMHSTTSNEECLLLLPPNISHGEELFSQNCSSCHPGGTNVISRERNLQKEALDKFIGLSDEEEGIISFVKNSNIHRGALAFTNKLSDQDFEDVGRFVYIQSMENKW